MLFEKVIFQNDALPLGSKRIKAVWREINVMSV